MPIHIPVIGNDNESQLVHTPQKSHFTLPMYTIYKLLITERLRTIYKISV